MECLLSDFCQWNERLPKSMVLIFFCEYESFGAVLIFDINISRLVFTKMRRRWDVDLCRGESPKETMSYRGELDSTTVIVYSNVQSSYVAKHFDKNIIHKEVNAYSRRETCKILLKHTTDMNERLRWKWNRCWS